jgi:hypothetical protein
MLIFAETVLKEHSYLKGKCYEEWKISTTPGTGCTGYGRKLRNRGRCSEGASQDAFGRFLARSCLDRGWDKGFIPPLSMELRRGWSVHPAASCCSLLRSVRRTEHSKAAGSIVGFCRILRVTGAIVTLIREDSRLRFYSRSPFFAEFTSSSVSVTRSPRSVPFRQA